MNLAELSRRDSEPFMLLQHTPLQVFEQQAISFPFESAAKPLTKTAAKPLTKQVFSVPRTHIMHLAASIRNEFIVPSLRSRGRQEYLKFWTEKLREFDETVRAFRVLVKRSYRPSSLISSTWKGWESVRRKIETALTTVGGPNAADEFDFCFSTAERTNRLISKFGDAEPSDTEKDRELLLKYLQASALFTVGLFSFSDMAGGVKVRSHEVFEEVFSFLRQGALHSYAAAREAYSLRQPEEGSPGTQGDELYSGADDVALAELFVEDAATIAHMCKDRHSARE